MALQLRLVCNKSQSGSVSWKICIKAVSPVSVNAIFPYVHVSYLYDCSFCRFFLSTNCTKKKVDHRKCLLYMECPLLFEIFGRTMKVLNKKFVYVTVMCLCYFIFDRTKAWIFKCIFSTFIPKNATSICNWITIFSSQGLVIRNLTQTIDISEHSKSRLRYDWCYHLKPRSNQKTFFLRKWN
jgi:hypothetical protein